MQPEAVEQLIKDGLKEADVYVEGDGSHFTALVVSSLFSGKNRIQRQKIVYDTVNEHLLSGKLHALSVKALTPDEWQALDGAE